MSDTAVVAIYLLGMFAGFIAGFIAALMWRDLRK